MNEENTQNQEFKVIKTKNNWATFGIILFIFIAILAAVFMIFAVYNSQNDRIISGIYIKGINVSGLTKQEARNKLIESLGEELEGEIKLRHLEYETSIGLEQIEAQWDIQEAVEKAYQMGRESNIIKNNMEILKIMVSNINIEPILNYREEELEKLLDDISTKLPDTIIQSSYYIDGNNLVITKGKKGNIVDVDKMKEILELEMKNISYTDKWIELEINEKEPNPIDIERIYQEIHKEPVDAYYTKDPFVIHPSEEGVDFAISLEEAKKLLEEEKEEYVVPIKIITPNITTSMIGTEAFPDLLSSFSTKYSEANKNRTTNLKLAAGKINGIVIMPGETFSYNTTVGERTIAAGYKEAAIYQNGQVTDGLGGGICQISTTLYNAVVYANLEIVERRNHMFIPSYVGAGRDATVVYGSTDFKFKNNRSYPIKILCYVQGGVAKFEIFGLKEDDDYEVEIKTKITGSIPFSTQYVSKAGVTAGKVIQNGKNGTRSETYKILKKNGQVVSTELLSKDTYRAMNKLIAK